MTAVRSPWASAAKALIGPLGGLPGAARALEEAGRLHDALRMRRAARPSGFVLSHGPNLRFAKALAPSARAGYAAGRLDAALDRAGAEFDAEWTARSPENAAFAEAYGAGFRHERGVCTGCAAELDVIERERLDLDGAPLCEDCLRTLAETEHPLGARAQRALNGSAR